MHVLKVSLCVASSSSFPFCRRVVVLLHTANKVKVRAKVVVQRVESAAKIQQQQQTAAAARTTTAAQRASLIRF